MKPDLVRQIAIVITTLAVIAVNALANILPINGQNTGEISDRFKVYFVPAGYVFSIWGLIYLLLIAYTVFQALPANQADPTLRAIGYLYVLAGAANIAWLLLWHYERFGLTLVAMFGLLGLLIAIYLRADIGRVTDSRGWFWLAHLPFSVYLGWITVATIANVTSVLDYWKWDGWGIRPETWAVIMLGITAAITAAMLLTRSDIAYGLVIVWAAAGIAVKQAAVQPVRLAAWTVAGVVAVLIVAVIGLRFAGSG